MLLRFDIEPPSSSFCFALKKEIVSSNFPFHWVVQHAALARGGGGAPLFRASIGAAGAPPAPVVSAWGRAEGALADVAATVSS